MRKISLVAWVWVIWFMGSITPAQEKMTGGVTVIDGAGKEIKLKSWKLLAGTWNLSWLADKAAPPDKKKKETAGEGPQALDFREDKSTSFQNGIRTLVPLSSIRTIDYDNEKKTMAVTCAAADGKDQILTGTTKYVGINKLLLEGEVDLGDLGVATVKFQGGHPKDGIRGLRFADAKPAGATTGKIAVLAQDKEKHQVAELVPLYRSLSGQLQILPTLYFKTTVKINVAKIQKIRHVEAEGKNHVSHDYEITLHDGAKHTLTLLDRNPDDPKTAPVLVGLVGRVPAGYKLFPPHTISEVQFEEGKKE